MAAILIFLTLLHPLLNAVDATLVEASVDDPAVILAATSLKVL